MGRFSVSFSSPARRTSGRAAVRSRAQISLVGPVPFVALRAMVAEGQAALLAFDRDEIERAAGKELDLQIGPRRLAFTAETFVLSFSLPNFHFHAITAYDILRSRGVPIGKRDYEGPLRTRAG